MGPSSVLNTEVQGGSQDSEDRGRSQVHGADTALQGRVHITLHPKGVTHRSVRRGREARGGVSASSGSPLGLQRLALPK